MTGFDYRNEIRAYFNERKKRKAQYSLRALARDLQVSVTALHGVLNKERHFSKKNLEAIALRLGWSEDQLLRALDSLHWTDDKTETILTEDRFQMIADWVHLAVLNLARIPQMQSTSVSERLGLEPAHCEEVIERLVRLEFLEIQQGILVRKQPSFGTTQSVPSAAVRSFHHKNLLKAQACLESVPLAQRDFLTIAAPSNLRKVAEIKKMIQEFRRQVLQVLDTEEMDDVYFLNIQLYPVTQNSILNSKSSSREPS